MQPPKKEAANVQLDNYAKRGNAHSRVAVNHYEAKQFARIHL